MIVREIMTANVISVTPETSLKELSSLLSKNRIAGVPVLENGAVVGTVSEAEVVAKEAAPYADATSLFRRRGRKRRHETLLEATRVRDVMTGGAPTIELWRSVHAAAQRLVDSGASRLLVLDDGVLAGIVTQADLVKAFRRSDYDIDRELRAVVLPSLGLSGNDVAVSVKDGVVTLEGAIAHDWDARKLVQATSSVVGVVRVESKLTVAAPS